MAYLLVVDDDADLAAVLAEVLRAEGHCVRTAIGGEEGLRSLNEKLPDLVLLDVEMPGMTGPTMAVRMFLHDHGAEYVPILLASGVPDLHRVASAVGTPYYVSKGFQIPELLDVLGRALRERRPPAGAETRHQQRLSAPPAVGGPPA
ncbi:MAG TPA: response regulator [Polyangia bacterium]|jgi:DNA-binding response OmpR family regulator